VANVAFSGTVSVPSLTMNLPSCKVWLASPPSPSSRTKSCFGKIIAVLKRGLHKLCSPRIRVGTFCCCQSHQSSRKNKGDAHSLLRHVPAPVSGLQRTATTRASGMFGQHVVGNLRIAARNTIKDVIKRNLRFIGRASFARSNPRFCQSQSVPTNKDRPRVFPPRITAAFHNSTIEVSAAYPSAVAESGRPQTNAARLPAL